MTIAIRDASAANRDAHFDRYRVGLHHLALRARSRADVDAFHGFLSAKKSRCSTLLPSIRNMEKIIMRFSLPIPTA